jgi:RHS repeat-associated protein
LVSVKETGYLFIYLSYDNENTQPVYFDELKINHIESPVVQVNDYYPYGLTAYSWIREGEYENRFLYQGKELDQKTGWHNFHARQYDASLGRWFAVDPAGQFSSPYVGMGNNPVMGVDPDGRFWNFIIGAVVGGIGGYSTGKALGKSGWDLFAYTAAGAGIGFVTSGAGAAVSAAGGGAVLAGAASGAVAGAGFSGLQSNWNGEAMLKGAAFGAISGFVGGGVASAIGGGGGAFVGGIASDATSQLLSTGDVNLLQAGISGALSFGMYEGMSKLNYEFGSKKFGDIDLTYKEFKTIQAEYQRSRFWRKEHGVFLLHKGDPIVAKKSWLSKDGIDWPTYEKMEVDIDNIKAQWHSHWSKSHSLEFSGYDLKNPFNQMNTNRFYSNVNYNSWDPNYGAQMTNESFRVYDNFLKYFLLPIYVR